jgi:hypothetical protein
LALLQDLIGANSESEDEIVALDWICDYENDDIEGKHMSSKQGTNSFDG